MQTKLFLRIISVIALIATYSVENCTAQDNKVYKTSTVAPSYPGGKDAMAKFLKANVKYPAAANTAKIKGTVVISCIVEKTGALTNLDVANSIGGGCDEEALRVVRKMPKWNPGTIANKPVRVFYKISVKFP